MTQSRVCTRCISDETFPDITFDEAGVCKYCKLHDTLDRELPNGSEGRKIIEKAIAAMKRRNRKKKFDCLVGISGGRDSTYTLWALKQLGLRVLAVHFNDGFGNPVAGENMVRATDRLGIPLRTITSDWRLSRDIRVAFLKSSTPDIAQGTDLGIAAALYGCAAREGVRDIIIGQSFRTEGIAPLEWSYLDGKYLRAVHKRFGTVPPRPWKPADPGFNLELKHMIYYALIRGIRVFPILYYADYIRSEATALIEHELGWVNPGAHYFDDLYQALMNNVLRVKFGIDRRKFNYSALVRSGQMSRDDALARISNKSPTEDGKNIDLCLKRIGMPREDFEKILELPPKTFRDYPTHYSLIRAAKPIIALFSRLGILPQSTYLKYFQ
jgi:hypothetical protein